MNDNRNGNELYKRVLPALKCKKEDLHKNGYRVIKEKDIWNLLLANKWNKERKIALCDIVDDILNTPNGEIMDFYIDEQKNHEIIELPRLKNE